MTKQDRKEYFRAYRAKNIDRLRAYDRIYKRAMRRKKKLSTDLEKVL